MFDLLSCVSDFCNINVVYAYALCLLSGFGSTAGATNVVAAPTAPIVLGADVNQTLIQNAIIEAQLASCPYGDSPLLKLVSNDSLKKADIPSPTKLVFFT